MVKAEHYDSVRSWVVWIASITAYLIAVTQRTSFGVAGLEATDRFNASASILATFSVVQLVVYAGLQIPVGILVDKWGPRAMITGGAALMMIGQFLLAMADSVGAGLVGRFFVGAGDAMTFVSVIRLLPIWFSGYRIPMLTQVTGMVGQLGQLLSLIPFVALLHLWSWTPAFLSLAALSVLGFALALVLISNGPRSQQIPAAPAKARLILANAWREPGTRLGFWTHFTTQFTTNVFLLTWGYPFLVSGQGVSPGDCVGTAFNLCSRRAGGRPGAGRCSRATPAPPLGHRLQCDRRDRVVLACGDPVAGDCAHVAVGRVDRLRCTGRAVLHDCLRLRPDLQPAARHWHGHRHRECRRIPRRRWSPCMWWAGC